MGQNVLAVHDRLYFLKLSVWTLTEKYSDVSAKSTVDSPSHPPTLTFPVGCLSCLHFCSFTIREWAAVYALPQCSVTCGEGMERRLVTCRIGDQCNGDKPENVRQCRPGPCHGKNNVSQELRTNEYLFKQHRWSFFLSLWVNISVHFGFFRISKHLFQHFSKINHKIQHLSFVSKWPHVLIPWFITVDIKSTLITSITVEHVVQVHI